MMDRNLQGNIRSFAVLLMQPPCASAVIRGSTAYQNIHGIVQFYQTRKGVLVAAEIDGLPHSDGNCQQPVFGFHIHDGGQCEGDMYDLFSGAMAHYNPNDCMHPFHAGDLPPLFSNHGYAFSTFLTYRFSLSEVIGRTLIIHGNPDDFKTQPSGNAGEKLACGVIKACRNRCS